jgi:hypothetical protein
MAGATAGHGPGPRVVIHTKGEKMRKLVVALIGFALSALVAGYCVSAIRSSKETEARQDTVPRDAAPPRPHEWRPTPAYELDDVWPF